MLPLFALPFGVWLVQQEWANFGTCAMKSVFGIPCLTCGATRGTVRLLYGDIAGAFSYQPMIMVVYLLLATWGLTSLGLFVQDKRAKLHLNPTETRMMKVALIAVPLVNWVYLIAAGI